MLISVSNFQTLWNEETVGRHLVPLPESNSPSEHGTNQEFGPIELILLGSLVLVCCSAGNCEYGARVEGKFRDSQVS